MFINCIQAHTIGEAWRDVMLMCIQRGYDYVVEWGSYEGQIRRQLESVMIIIKEPSLRPLAPILPPSVPAPTSDGKIATYFADKIVGMTAAKNEAYTYGQFIVPQLDRIIALLKRSGGNTNQATIAVGDKDTTFLDDPPCLRSVSFKVVNGRLNMTVYFRSWDLYAGMPENLGGLQWLKELVLMYINTDVKTKSIQDGKIIAFSDGLHLYEQYFDIANCLNTSKIVTGKEVNKAKLKYEKENGI